MNKDFESEKDLFDYVRSKHKQSHFKIKNILSGYNLSTINIYNLLLLLKSDSTNILLIDTRSEKEFEESQIPYSKNFPVLNNLERHYTGLIFKKYSNSAAIQLAMEFADPKTDSLKKFLHDNKADKKDIIVHCWRGGGRSGYLAKMIFDAGYNAKTLEGGFKAYRKTVYSFFKKEFTDELLEITGFTGCGKSEIIEYLSNDLPVIDLETSARHYSSLLGHIPYLIRGFNRVKSQSAFENSLFSQIYFNRNILTGKNYCLYVIESESRRVGNFDIPEMLYQKLESSKCIKLTASIESRIRRIVRDYFGKNYEGIEPMIKVMSEKERYFRQQLSTKLFDELMMLLEKKRVEEFTEIMIREYYDKKYKDKGKNPVAVISTENILQAVKEVKSVYQSLSIQ